MLSLKFSLETRLHQDALGCLDAASKSAAFSGRLQQEHCLAPVAATVSPQLWNSGYRRPEDSRGKHGRPMWVKMEDH